jgi:hypothetical protein
MLTVVKVRRPVMNLPEARDGKLHLVLLGSPSVQRAGVSVTGFISTKAQALLYYPSATPEHDKTTREQLHHFYPLWHWIELGLGGVRSGPGNAFASLLAWWYNTN